MSFYVIYTNRGGGLYQIYKPEAKPSVIHLIQTELRGLYIASKLNDLLHSMASKFWTLMFFKL